MSKKPPYNDADLDKISVLTDTCLNLTAWTQRQLAVFLSCAPSTAREVKVGPRTCRHEARVDALYWLVEQVLIDSEETPCSPTELHEALPDEIKSRLKKREKMQSSLPQDKSAGEPSPAEPISAESTPATNSVEGNGALSGELQQVHRLLLEVLQEVRGQTNQGDFYRLIIRELQLVKTQVQSLREEMSRYHNETVAHLTGRKPPTSPNRVLAATTLPIVPTQLPVPFPRPPLPPLPHDVTSVENLVWRLDAPPHTTLVERDYLLCKLEDNSEIKALIQLRGGRTLSARYLDFVLMFFGIPLHRYRTGRTTVIPGSDQPRPEVLLLLNMEEVWSRVLLAYKLWLSLYCPKWQWNYRVLPNGRKVSLPYFNLEDAQKKMKVANVPLHDALALLRMLQSDMPLPGEKDPYPENKKRASLLD